MSPHKAVHYLRALDEARCDGNWSAVPELVRKVRKHAPERSCLALVAEAEAAISQATLTHASSTRTSTALTAEDLGVAGHLPKILGAIESESHYLEDRFQAKVCVGWLHWVVGEYGLASQRLPQNLDDEYTDLEGAENVSDWTNVCALKAAYLKANCAARNNERIEALYVFETGLPALTSVWTSKFPKQQLRYWAELFLTEYCMLSSQALQRHERSLEDTNSIACFRTWARYWEIQSGPLPGGHGFRGSVPRRRIWHEYYSALSRIIEEDLPFPTGYIGKLPTEQHTARTRLRMELKKVENAYESLLLHETQFPRADEEREEVEAFINLVMKNWTIMCGRGWREYDLGQGGRESMSRGILEILYRAATKTYHSTAILRHLFTVHLAVAEFDLAFKAYSSYRDIVTKAKARVDKTGIPEPHLDDDATVLTTMSQCAVALCRYGDKNSIEKARDVAAELEDFLARLPQVQSGGSESASLALPEIRESPLQPQIAPRVLAEAWQAIGLAHASWSRVTYDSNARMEIQTKAVRCLRKSLSPEFGRSRSYRGLFALSLLLAERRELTPAIELVKVALASGKTADGHADLIHGPYWQERALIPLWHLLGLLLSARQDYGMAARACEGAFEQFKDPWVLFGHQDQSFRSDHLNEAEARREKPNSTRAIVDEMDFFEKENILEVKMTQLSLVELVDGPEIAVNASPELLSLYTRLFGTVQPKAPAAPPKTAEVPKTSGTLRSIKGSIFGRSSRHGDARQMSIVSDTSLASTRPQTTQTTASAAPTIQITQENGQSVEMRPPKTPAEGPGRRRSQSGRRNSLRKRDPSRSRRRAASTGPTPRSSFATDGESVFTPDGDPPSDVFAFTNRRQPSIASSFSRGRTLPHMDSYFSAKPRPVEYSDIPTDAYNTMPTPLPIVQFSKEEDQKQKKVILVNVWLMIAGFYRRANMFDDCRGAIAEAKKIVQGMEAEAAKDTTTPMTQGSTRWGEKKSIDQLWADVYAELGNLAVTNGEPYVARGDFESALTYFSNHPVAIVGLSNILLDIYTEELLPPPTIPQLDMSEEARDGILNTPKEERGIVPANRAPLPATPLGLAQSKRPEKSDNESDGDDDSDTEGEQPPPSPGDKRRSDELPPPHKATSLPLVDRFAARDRAYGLLSGLTKLGSGWNYSEAWFTLARAHEESGQVDKAKEALWWCVELEEGRGVREWDGVGAGSYILS
ncbi:hypothetical protein jhhlp_001955 [Lomentospora prolificans]|uniref:Filamentation protein n=1 Tax=Lomentospora prolificans TaxID=41688 RepID=A0A2N3NCN3_9PEZI|nr:hypothetical protein jhhlp_001955 [Lomentospora prolificans]